MLGNSTRRIILKKLARFPETGMNPEDLQQDLGVSRPAILKNIHLLLAQDLVEPVEVPSHHKGLTRTNYRIKRNLSITFDLGTTYVNMYCRGCDEKPPRAKGEQKDLPSFLKRVYKTVSTEKNDRDALEGLLKTVSGKIEEVESELGEVEEKRRQLIYYKNELLKVARELANRVHLRSREWEILNAILSNWRLVTSQELHGPQWLFYEVASDRLRKTRRDSLMRDIEAFFGDLKKRFRFLADI